MFNNISTPIKYIVGTAGVIVLLLLLWLYATKGANGIKSFLFYRKANAEQQKVNEQLEKAKQQQALIDETLKEFAAAKEELAKAKEARIEAERIFNDASKTAKEKVAAYEEAMSGTPIHTDPTGLTTDDLCARAKALGGSQATIDALCSSGQ